MNESKNKTNAYLVKVFQLIRCRDEIVFVDKKTHFNKTELRLLSEVLAAKADGKRLISTQLADRLGITRSAVSQMVNRLEERGVIQRIPSRTDKKIAYIEISEAMLEQYGEDIQRSKRFVGSLVREFGEERFNLLCSLTEEFVALAKKSIATVKKEKAKK